MIFYLTNVGDILIIEVEQLLFATLAAMARFLSLMIGLRFKQALRVLQSVGWGYVLLIIPIVVLIFGFRVMEVLLNGEAVTGAGLLLLPVLTSHFGRKDHHFLKQIAPYLYRSFLFLIEYLLLLTPFWVLLLFMGRGDIVLIFALGCILVAFVDQRWMPAVKWKTFSFNWIPIRAFEWRSGMRRLGFLLFFFLVIGLIASHWVWSIPGTLIICALLSTGIYQDLESKELVEGPFDIKYLLWQKIGLHAALFHSCFALSYIVYFIRHSELWWILVLSIIAVQLLISFSILVKYANWLPNREKHSAQTMIAVFAAGLLIPYLAPASLLLWGYYYFKANKRLEYFYHAKS